jgi:hypothetical protein
MSIDWNTVANVLLALSALIASLAAIRRAGRDSQGPDQDA